MTSHSDSPADAADRLHAPAPVRDALHALLSAAPQASTTAIGLHRKGRRALLVRGRTAHHGGVPADTGTRFEVGSLTKTFTALLLAEQAARGELDLHDPLARHLPAGTALPRNGTVLTLTHLATHTSGLPRLPPGLLRSAAPRLLTNPYARFTTDDVLHTLARTRLRAAPGTRVHYSNFGVGLLGYALTGAASLGHTSYPALLDDRVLMPFYLRDTGCTTTAPTGGTQVTGHWRRRVRPPFHIPGLAAAGALRSSARDLLTFVENLLDPASAEVPTALRAALSDVQRPRLRLPRGSGLALIWNIRPRRDSSHLYHHSGGTRGCTAFAGFNPHHGTALVALANTAPGAGNTLIQDAYTTLLAL
ncbi:serine hydrolase domain-containing protein [Streptomyces violaceus]|uniref:Serine hydrolase domain-containing protein n=1 Tax=Streptomyces violaceus TaxID=1936 RepID=A0ABY9TZY2_STRVL|nr:serine hydrolase domain-containing protein [Streptomyces janthinus]WND15977.1 serine hydrolase domain-containing protein [Streptomyces janthinus]GGT00532.1 penicillin-binding protein [Streptomyces janthinus]